MLQRGVVRLVAPSAIGPVILTDPDDDIVLAAGRER